MTDDITRMLNSTIPEDSDPAAWGPAARRRSASHRVAKVVTAVALVAAVAVPVGYLLSQQRNDAVPAQSPSPGPSPSSAPSPAPSGAPVTGDNPCQSILSQFKAGVVPLTPIGEGLPADASKVWLCGDPTNDFESFGPAEPLTVGVADAVAAINALPVAPADRACTEEYRLTYYVVVDGASRWTVKGELHGCQIVDDGAVAREGGQDLLTTLTGLWLKQRERATPPGAPEAQCPAHFSLVPASASVGAALCQTSPSGEVHLLQFEDQAVVAALPSAKVGSDAGLGEQMPGIQLVFRDQWSSTLVLAPLVNGGWVDVQTNQAYVFPAQVDSGIRAHFTPPPASAGCERTGPFLDAIDDVDRGHACLSTESGTWSEVALAPAQAAEIARLIQAEQIRIDPVQESAVTGHRLILGRPDGNNYVFERAVDGSFVWSGDGGVWYRWVPQGELALKLTDLFTTGS